MKKWALALSALFLSHAAMADWQYSESTDKMTGKVKSTAYIRSDNSLDLSFPYAGTNHATLIVRMHPQYGLNVIMQVQKGQILCSSYSGCPIQVKFDDAAPVRFNGSESADHDSSVVFVNNANKFIQQATKSKKILVQVNMYHAGAPVLEFSMNEPLKWQTATPKRKK